MASKSQLDLAKQSPHDGLPSLIKHITSQTVIGFDSVESGTAISPLSQSSRSSIPLGDMTFNKESEHIKIHSQPITSMHSPVQALKSHRSHAVSMPSTPSGLQIEQAKRVQFNDKAGPTATRMPPDNFKEERYDSFKTWSGKLERHLTSLRGKAQEPDNYKDKRYNSFKTWSGKLERQLTSLRGKPQEPEEVDDGSQISDTEDVPEVKRYFDALEGTELDTLKPSESSVLPLDKKWPFLLRFPASSFGICLGVSSQAILWKTLATSPSTSFLHISLNVNLILWCISVALVGVVSLIYSLKIILYYKTVKREYYHPVRVNFFFAPWIAFLFLALGVPPSVTEKLHPALWYVLMFPIFCLELKIYGQWMSGGRRRLSKVANPSNHLSIVGNFVGALLGASMGLKEGPIFFFAVGLAHYTVLFVTLYQRLPSNETLPRDLHPIFFLFVAAPSVACMAWAKIQGDFDIASRMAYFIALFLYASLAVRIDFFTGFRFSLSWWAYTFPMTGVSIATVRYSNEVTSWLTRALAVGLSAISTITVLVLLLSTIFHAVVLHDLFPNDISIAITNKKLIRSEHIQDPLILKDINDEASQYDPRNISAC